MNISGPTPINPRLDDPAATFRLHQRFEAEVLQVAGERVTLTVSGVAIVARMTSPEQAAILTQQRRAQFQVQETGAELRLKLIRTGSAPAGETARMDHDPAAGLLKLVGLPADEINLQLARACLQNRVILTKEFVQQMRSSLEQALSPPPGEKGGSAPTGAALANAAHTAVSWAASGRTLTPATLALLLQDLPELSGMIASLRAGLAAARGRLSPEDAARLDSAIDWLDDLQVELPSKGDLAEKLQKAIGRMGRSLESELAKQAEENKTGETAHSGLFNLALLSRRLQPEEHAPLLGKIEQFMATLNLQNLRNTPPGLPAGQEHWLALEIPCAFGAAHPPADAPPAPVQLRVLQDTENESRAGMGGKSRFILQAEVAPGKLIEVDLSILERRVQVYISTPDANTLTRAQEELGSLNEGLERLGYEVQDSVLGVKETPAQQPPTETSGAGHRRADWKA